MVEVCCFTGEDGQNKKRLTCLPVASHPKNFKGLMGLDFTAQKTSCSSREMKKFAEIAAAAMKGRSMPPAINETFDQPVGREDHHP